MDILIPLNFQILSAHPVTNPPAGYMWQYVLADGFYQKDSSGNVTQLSGSGITSGTAAPSGGVDGDIYLQYTP